MSVVVVSKNESEVGFEQYLEAQGIPDWGFEPEYPGKRKRPDYRVAWREDALLFDLKEFRGGRPLTPGFRYVDPYRKIREKIEAARKKFKEFDESCCSVVLYNAGSLDVRLDQPEFVMGAMLGDFGFRFEVPANQGATRSMARWPLSF